MGEWRVGMPQCALWVQMRCCAGPATANDEHGSADAGEALRSAELAGPVTAQLPADITVLESLSGLCPGTSFHDWLGFWQDKPS